MPEIHVTETQYAQLCDAISRILFADRYQIEPYEFVLEVAGVEHMHTSSEARRLALAVVTASPVQ